jgi:hypothetical protein
VASTLTLIFRQQSTNSQPISVFSDFSAHAKPFFVSTLTMEQHIMSGAEQVDYKEIAQSL